MSNVENPPPSSKVMGPDWVMIPRAALDEIAKLIPEIEAELEAALKAVIDDLEIRSRNGVVNLSHGVYCTARAVLATTTEAKP